MTKVKKVSDRINNGNHLLYYAFDHDDNILKMPTAIHMEKRVGDNWIPVKVPTSDYTSVRKNPDYRLLPDVDSSYSEFRDDGPRGDNAFLEDVITAVRDRKFGPAWGDFVECLTNGSLFSIITARGHESGPLRKGYEWIIDNVLSEEELFTMYANLRKFDWLFDREENHPHFLIGKPSSNQLFKKYLDYCEFNGISSPSNGGSPANPEKEKEKVLLNFKKRMNDFAQGLGLNAKIGFSDDDPGNVKHIEELMDNINNEKFPNIISFVVKGTKDPDNITKKVRVYEANIHNQSPGMQSSIVPFASFNNMKDRLTTDPGERDKSHRLAKQHIMKLSSELTDEVTEDEIEKNNDKNENIPYFPL
jgi:hypothetical protein